MAQLLVGQIAQVAGLPGSVRIGTVVQADPLVVSVQGAVYNAEAVGVVEPGIPAVGQPVALLGQAGLSGGDPASWLALGSIRAGTAAASSTEWDLRAALVSTTSLTYVTTGTVCGTGFIAPSTGRVTVSWRAGLLTSGGASTAHASPRISEGALGAGGNVIAAAQDGRAISTPFASTQDYGASSVIDGLTPGAAYNATLMHRTSNAASAALFVNREIIVAPAP